MRIVRRIWWLVMVALFILLVVGANVKIDALAGMGFLGMICWWFTGAFFSRIIGSMIVTSFRCKGCGLEIPAVGRWQIGSYNDHRDRHFLLAKNPIDGSRVGHIDCPQCSSTILL